MKLRREKKGEGKEAKRKHSKTLTFNFFFDTFVFLYSKAKSDINTSRQEWSPNEFSRSTTVGTNLG